MEKNKFENVKHDEKKNMLFNIAQVPHEKVSDLLDKGYQDMLAGRTKPAEEVFEDIRNKHE